MYRFIEYAVSCESDKHSCYITKNNLELLKQELESGCVLYSSIIDRGGALGVCIEVFEDHQEFPVVTLVLPSPPNSFVRHISENSSLSLSCADGGMTLDVPMALVGAY